MVEFTKEKFIHITEILFQQILAVFVLLILWELFKTNDLSSKHTWHVLLCVLGFAVCMAEGVQIYRKESLFSFGGNRADRILGHGIVMFFALICITVGIALKISQKSSHFHSMHGKLGLSAWIIAFVAGLGGLVTAYSRGLSFLPKPAIMKLVHLVIGVSAYILGIVALGYGLHDYMGLGKNGSVFMIVLLSLYVCYSLIEPCLTIFNMIVK